MLSPYKIAMLAFIQRQMHRTFFIGRKKKEIFLAFPFRFSHSRPH